MLVKDITLVPAIVDLVDNSVDGARRIREDNYEGLFISINFSREEFSIVDNCGGIPLDIAENYAFRFGRPKEMKHIPGSLGRFGIGMKRAIFKIGNWFRIESCTNKSKFSVEVDVSEWKNDPENWTFAFQDLEENKEQDKVNIGTRIKISDLHENIKSEFALANFQTKLIRNIEDQHLRNIENGLSISVNGIALSHDPIEILESNEIKPMYYEEVFEGKSIPDKLNVRMYSGISESDPNKAGWYVFCNGRLILGADQTETTGWGEKGGITIPRFHNQYARFRGFVFFDSENPKMLPWNTTKTDVDADSSYYRKIRLKMIQMMRPVIDFLNLVDAENDLEDPDERVLQKELNKSKLKRLTEVETTARFVIPDIESRPSKPGMGRISYKKPIEEIKLIQDMLNVSTYKDVGVKTFEYFIEMEVD